MRLFIHQDVNPTARQFLTEVFDLVTERLGISDYNRIVLLSLKKLPTVNGDICGGCMAPLDGLNKFHVILNDAAPTLYLGVASLCHEMIHVKQFLTKAITPDPVNGTLYFGQPVTHLPYEQQPFEKEALKDMWPLADYVAKKLGIKKEVKL